MLLLCRPALVHIGQMRGMGFHAEGEVDFICQVPNLINYQLQTLHCLLLIDYMIRGWAYQELIDNPNSQAKQLGMGFQSEGEVDFICLDHTKFRAAIKQHNPFCKLVLAWLADIYAYAENLSADKFSMKNLYHHVELSFSPCLKPPWTYVPMRSRIFSSIKKLPFVTTF